MAKRSTNGHGGYGHNSSNIRQMASAWTKRSYRHIDKDPEIDRVRTLFQREHLKESDFAVMAGVMTATVKNMFGGATRRPQHTTYTKMLNAMGYEYDIVRKREINYDKDLPKAREEFRAYKIAMAAKRERAEKK